MLKQRLDYLYNNTVSAVIDCIAEKYQYSSAIDYLTQREGLLKIKLLIC